MNNEATGSATGLERIHPRRLFIGSCFGLIATAVTFAVVGSIMATLKTQFVLTNEQVGFIGGAGLWGFTLSIFIFGPLCDALGMRFLLRLAFVAHVAGILTMIAANGFWMLLVGQLIIAMGNGLIEAACNPLIATVYPDRKTERLNQFHVWFPGGIAIGGVLAFLLSGSGSDARRDAIASFFGELGLSVWQVKLGAILIPTLIYGFMILREKFPATERVQAGITFGGMVRATFMRPLFLLLMFCMMLTASLELGPNRWVPAVLEAVGIHGILVLVWINLLMAIMRYYAGPVVHRLSPTGILFAGAIITGLGLMWLSYTETLVMALAAGTVFALGVCYFWPTMLGVVAERVPKGGALALALLGGIGNVAVGLVTIPLMGRIADDYSHEKLPPQTTVLCLEEIEGTFPALKAKAKGDTGADIGEALAATKKVLEQYRSKGTLLKNDTANALRAAERSAPDSAAAKEAKKLLGPADNYGGRISFRYVVVMAGVLAVIFGLLYASDRRRGGYKPEQI